MRTVYNKSPAYIEKKHPGLFKNAKLNIRETKLLLKRYEPLAVVLTPKITRAIVYRSDVASSWYSVDIKNISQSTYRNDYIGDFVGFTNFRNKQTEPGDTEEIAKQMPNVVPAHIDFITKRFEYENYYILVQLYYYIPNSKKTNGFMMQAIKDFVGKETLDTFGGLYEFVQHG